MSGSASVSLRNALPFWISLSLIPLVMIAAHYGGWALLLPPAGAWWLASLLDAILGRNTNNADPETPEQNLFWYRFITIIWLPIQVLLIYGVLQFVTHSNTLVTWEKIALMFGVGIVSGSVGIVYSHELMHQSNKLERWLADLLLATVLYSHFRTEHLLVHHPWVGTSRDAVTARYNEGFHRYFARVIHEVPRSAWQAEKAMLARRSLPVTSLKNPFWRYGLLQAIALLAAFLIGGWAGIGFFVFQSFVAMWQLELTNYVEHYGLTRKHLGEGKYEHVRPHHSWNSDHMATNWQFINLQRHSDHHYKPARRFPLLQTYDADTAPLLPRGYPLMTMAAMVPPVWRRLMNPRVRAWRRKYYPDIEDWTPYKEATLPPPQIR
ncbi:MAG TPA: alkane 1-monooxygenase [Rhodobacterales bacterium]|nr:alkane 1-monooxygenase [Rhodobacterales bacterium]